MSGRLKGELTLLERYNDDLETLNKRLIEADPQTSKHIQREIDQKLEIYWRQIQLVKTQFPDEEDGLLHEAAFYTHQASRKIFEAGIMRRMSHRSGNVAVGLATALIAKQQEKSNAMQALTILDQALKVFDYPGAHLAKAEIFRALGNNQNALYELNYIISNFPDDESYVAARQIKDEIENPPKKGMCFVATAAYGSPLAPEVVRLSRFRDEVLLGSEAGTLFVKFYYLTSPPLARLIGRSPLLCSATRALLLRPVLRLLGR